MPSSSSRVAIRVGIVVFLLHFAICFSILRSAPSMYMVGPMLEPWQWDVIRVLNYPLLKVVHEFPNVNAMFAASAALWGTVLSLVVLGLRRVRHPSG